MQVALTGWRPSELVSSRLSAGSPSKTPGHPLQRDMGPAPGGTPAPHAHATKPKPRPPPTARYGTHARWDPLGRAVRTEPKRMPVPLRSGLMYVPPVCSLGRVVALERPRRLPPTMGGSHQRTVQSSALADVIAETKRSCPLDAMRIPPCGTLGRQRARHPSFPSSFLPSSFLRHGPTVSPWARWARTALTLTVIVWALAGLPGGM